MGLRKIALLGLLTSFILLGSCRKTYHCECVGTDIHPDGDVTTFNYTSVYKEWSKQKAKESCDRMSGDCSLR